MSLSSSWLSHHKLLQGLQQIVELEDAAIYHTTNHTTISSNTIDATLLTKWKCTNPNDNDPIYSWDNILTSRYFALRLPNERITGDCYQYQHQQ